MSLSRISHWVLPSPPPTPPPAAPRAAAACWLLTVYSRPRAMVVAVTPGGAAALARAAPGETACAPGPPVYAPAATVPAGPPAVPAAAAEPAPPAAPSAP